MDSITYQVAKATTVIRRQDSGWIPAFQHTALATQTMESGPKQIRHTVPGTCLAGYWTSLMALSCM